MNRTPEQDRAFEAWKARARDVSILDAAIERGAQLRRFGREYVGPCPVCGGRDRFAINVQEQVFICRGAAGGDSIEMVRHLEGLDFIPAIESLLGEPRPGRAATPLSPEEQAARDQRLQAAKESAQRREDHARRREDETKQGAYNIWSNGVPIDGTLAETYLRARGIERPPQGWPRYMRFRPTYRHPEGGHFPMLVARVHDHTATGVAIWRIYLSADGTRKAPVKNAKLGLGPAGGAAVRIGGIAAHIGVAEGVETALGAWSLIDFAYPVWAALSTAGMSGLILPAGIKNVTIFPDGDRPYRQQGLGYVSCEPAGRVAARKLRERLVAQGIEVVTATEPQPGQDYLDIWNEARRVLA